ncbi:MAG: pyrroline-5-carboxylate reductase [Defluviitaleaceae bacterium]|nr:pyrroline-5-carboxylate reductase [Defluviitaleaceae bacterium]
MDKKLGFIGAGNMATAIMGGIIKADSEMKKNIIVSDLSPEIRKLRKNELGVKVVNRNTTVAELADIIFLCVKPHLIETVIKEIKKHCDKDKIIVSIAAGKTLEQLRAAFEGKDVKIIRTMPNTPALVNRGTTAICPGEGVPKEDIKTVTEIFNMFGTATVILEEQMHAFIGVAGSSHAYAFMFIEALADAGVKHGLSRADAINFAAGALMGAAQMVISTPTHPAALRDAVCSPGGTTIAAVAELENHGFRNAIIKAAEICIQKSIEMSK